MSLCVESQSKIVSDKEKRETDRTDRQIKRGEEGRMAGSSRFFLLLISVSQLRVSILYPSFPAAPHQRRHFILVSLGWIFVAWQALAMVFVAPSEPEWRCVNGSIVCNETSITRSINHLAVT